MLTWRATGGATTEARELLTELLEIAYSGRKTQEEALALLGAQISETASCICRSPCFASRARTRCHRLRILCVRARAINIPQRHIRVRKPGAQTPLSFLRGVWVPRLQLECVSKRTAESLGRCSRLLSVSRLSTIDYSFDAESEMYTQESISWVSLRSSDLSFPLLKIRDLSDSSFSVAVTSGM